MTEMVKQVWLRFELPLLVPLLIGLGSSVIASREMNGKLDTRVGELETKVKDYPPLPDKIERLETTKDRHEKALHRDFLRHEQLVRALSSKTDDQEKRLTRLETLVGETQSLLAEIRADVKILLRGASNDRPHGCGRPRKPSAASAAPLASEPESRAGKRG